MTSSTSTTSASNPTTTTTRAGNHRRSWWLKATGALALFAVWFLTSWGQPELVFPGPTQTVAALWELASSGDLFSELQATIWRCLLGMLIALSIGIPWGLAAGAWQTVSDLGEFALRTLLAIPPVVFVVLGMIWLGPGPNAVILVVSLVGLPLMVVTARSAVTGLDADLVEMANAFELSRWRKLRYVMLPGIAGPVLAAISVLLGQSLRVTVMAELLAAASGVGHAVALSRSNLETADLFAWALALAVLAVVIEETVVRPVQRRALRSRQ